MLKQFILNHMWIIPVAAAFLTIGLGIFIGWLLTRNINMYSILDYDDSSKLEMPSNEWDRWHDNPSNPSNPLSQMNPNNPCSVIWNNHTDNS